MNNLVESIQVALGYMPLQKIDPNTQQVKVDENKPAEELFSQATIPSICIALYQFVQTEEGALMVLLNEPTTNWIEKLFDQNKKEVVEKISAYAKQSNEDPIAKINSVIQQAITIAKENATIKNNPVELRQYFNSQKNNILLYLPAALQIGVLLNNNSLDDNTNKMEGPISSLMQSIGAAFSSPKLEKE